ncbi:hypothetical protein HGRIS_009908 [Hohenbuehelia grisea]|uniref:Uncharacterized protein n=1 Tax=Hohenbuehelia grisea TaxID=104357 RepID=A0ABR3J328_9AGAR
MFKPILDHPLHQGNKAILEPQPKTPVKKSNLKSSTTSRSSPPSHSPNIRWDFPIARFRTIPARPTESSDIKLSATPPPNIVQSSTGEATKSNKPIIAPAIVAFTLSPRPPIDKATNNIALMNLRHVLARTQRPQHTQHNPEPLRCVAHGLLQEGLQVKKIQHQAMEAVTTVVCWSPERPRGASLRPSPGARDSCRVPEDRIFAELSVIVVKPRIDSGHSATSTSKDGDGDIVMDGPTSSRLAVGASDRGTSQGNANEDAALALVVYGQESRATGEGAIHTNQSHFITAAALNGPVTSSSGSHGNGLDFAETSRAEGATAYQATSHESPAQAPAHDEASIWGHIPRHERENEPIIFGKSDSAVNSSIGNKLTAADPGSLDTSKGVLALRKSNLGNQKPVEGTHRAPEITPSNGCGRVAKRPLAISNGGATEPIDVGVRGIKRPRLGQATENADTRLAIPSKLPRSPRPTTPQYRQASTRLTQRSKRPAGPRLPVLTNNPVIEWVNKLDLLHFVDREGKADHRDDKVLVALLDAINASKELPQLTWEVMRATHLYRAVRQFAHNKTTRYPLAEMRKAREITEFWRCKWNDRFA